MNSRSTRPLLEDMLVATKKGYSVYSRAFLKRTWKNTPREGTWWTVGYSYPKGPRATCPVCKEKIPPGTVRVSRCTASPFDSEYGAHDFCKHYHVSCAGISLARSRCNTSNVPLVGNDLSGFARLSKKEKKQVDESVRGAAVARACTCNQKKGASQDPVTVQVRSNKS